MWTKIYGLLLLFTFTSTEVDANARIVEDVARLKSAVSTLATQLERVKHDIQKEIKFAVELRENIKKEISSASTVLHTFSNEINSCTSLIGDIKQEVMQSMKELHESKKQQEQINLRVSKIENDSKDANSNKRQVEKESRQNTGTSLDEKMSEIKEALEKSIANQQQNTLKIIEFEKKHETETQRLQRLIADILQIKEKVQSSQKIHDETNSNLSVLLKSMSQLQKQVKETAVEQQKLSSKLPGIQVDKIDKNQSIMCQPNTALVKTSISPVPPPFTLEWKWKDALYRYYMGDDLVTWSAAIRKCQEQGFKLLYLESVEERDFIMDQIVPKKDSGWISKLDYVYTPKNISG